MFYSESECFVVFPTTLKLLDNFSGLHISKIPQNQNVLMVAGTKQPTTGDSKIKLWGYNPDTGNRLFTKNNIGPEFGLGSWGIVASYDNGFIITSNPSLIKMDSLGRF